MSGFHFGRLSHTIDQIFYREICQYVEPCQYLEFAFYDTTKNQTTTIDNIGTT
jgi:hypothetical protein